MFSQQRQADLLLVSTTVIAACGWIFSREAVAGMPVMAFIGIRFLLASLSLLLFCRRDDFRQLHDNLRPVLVSGGLQAVYILLWIYGVAIPASLGEGAFIMSLSMLFVPLAAWVLLKARPAAAFWVALPAAIVGLAFLTIRDGLHFELSQLLFLGAAVIQAIYFCYGSHYGRRVSIRILAAVQLGCTGTAALILSLLFENGLAPGSWSVWGWLLASVLIATTLRFWLQLKGQSMTSAAGAALIMLLEPLLTVVTAALWYGERMSGQQLTGCLLILFSLFYYRLRGRS